MTKAIKQQAVLLENQIWNLFEAKFSTKRTAHNEKLLENHVESYISNMGKVIIENEKLWVTFIPKGILDCLLALRVLAQDDYRSRSVFFLVAAYSTFSSTKTEIKMRELLEASYKLGESSSSLRYMTQSLQEITEERPSCWAKRLADKRHKETHQDREFVLDYWRKNIDPSLSAPKAADIIYEKNLINLSHRTVTEYIRKERKSMGFK